MEGIKLTCELIGLIIAASLVAFMTKPAETEFSRKALARYARRRQKKFNPQVKGQSAEDPRPTVPVE